MFILSSVLLHNIYELLFCLFINADAQNYFERHWHDMDIRKQWAGYMVNRLRHYQTRTNNRLESINQKIKGVVTRYTNMPKFFEQLLTCISSLNIEKEHRSIINNEKISTAMLPNSSYNAQYRDLLTYYAYSYVEKQIAQINQVVFNNVQGTIAVRIRHNLPFLTDPDKCDCIFYLTMRLPCKHMFALRRQNNMALFHESLCFKRWWKDTQTSRYASNYYLNLNSSNVARVNDVPNANAALSQNQKFAKIHKLLSSISEIMSEKPQHLFDTYYQNLEIFKNFVQGNSMCGVMEINNDQPPADQLNDNNQQLQQDLQPPADQLIDNNMMELNNQQRPANENNLFDNNGIPNIPQINQPQIQEIQEENLVLPPRIRKRGRLQGPTRKNPKRACKA